LCQAHDASFHSDNLIYLLLTDIIIHTTMSDIIIPATMSSDCPMSEVSDPFAVDIIPNSFPLSTETEVSEEGDPFQHLELSPNKRYAIWRRNNVEHWNPWWRHVLNSSKSNDKFGYFSWTKAKRSTVWEHFEQGADIQNGSPKALCKACWKVFAHPELRTGGSSTSTLRRHAEHKKCGGSKTGQGLLSQFGAGTMVSE
jgi:hypothetical protein